MHGGYVACCAADKSIHWCKDYPISTSKNGKSYCIFHSSKESKIDPISQQRLTMSEFNTLVYEEISRAKKENRKCDLSGTIFSGDISFRQFSKDNPLPEINFSDAVFTGNADFYGVVFSGKVDFVLTKFSNEANFSEATFGLNEDASFESAQFNEVVFRNSKFSGSAIFADAYFKKATFTGEIFLKQAVADFTFSKVEELITFTSVSLKNAFFQGVDMRKCHFISCQWHEKDGRNILRDEALLQASEVKHYGNGINGRMKSLLLADFRPFNIRQIGLLEDLYRQMKVKYRDMHDEFQASKWHASEKEMQRKKASIRNPFDWLLLNVYRSLCGYGESPQKALRVLLIMLFVCSVLLGWAGIITTKECHPRTIELANTQQDIRRTILYDLPLSTLQYAIFEKDPSFAPITRKGEYIKFLIKIMIPIQATLLVFALRNRFRR